MSDFSERDVDRVAAMGMAARRTALGTDVVRWTVAHDRYAALRVCKRLTVALQQERGMEAMAAVRVAQQAMLEFSEWACPTCGGRKEAKLVTGVVIVCDTCEGTGYRKFSNADRVRGTGQSYRSVAADLEWAIGELRSADTAANGRMNSALERK